MIDSIQVARYPISMVKYGLIPSEDQSAHDPPWTRFRVIWSASRWIRGFRNGAPEDLPVYSDPLGMGRALSPDVGECWVLEKWMSCSQIAGAVSEAEWNANPMYTAMGGYPKHGWYEYCAALSCNPGDANLDLLIAAASKRHREFDNYESIVKDQAKQKAERKRVRADRMENVMRPWAADAYVAYGGSQGTKTDKWLLSAREAGLPGKEGTASTFVPKKNEVFEVKISI